MLLHICTHGPRVPVYSVVTGPALCNLSGNSRCSVPLEAFLQKFRVSCFFLDRGAQPVPESENDASSYSLCVLASVA